MVKVLDDDSVRVTLMAETVSVEEGAGHVAMCVNLTGKLEQSVVVTMETSPITAKGVCLRIS